jgi:flagellar assembly factor FliW
MIINTTRFGCVVIDRRDIIRFPEGLLGLSDCRDWVVLADTQNDAVAWMQSVERPEIALAVVSPRRFVPDYQVRVASRELEPLKLRNVQAAQVLTVVAKTRGSLTLNLRAPLVLNLKRRLGRQIIANGELPVRHEIQRLPAIHKRIA